MSTRAIEDRRHLNTAVDLVVGPRLRPLAGFTVNRVWPIPVRRLIGPFIFLDHLQATELPAGSGFDVPPHPHIGIATVTWLFEGELMHADSLGCRQAIRPGDLNWMSAGRGITHSERSTDAARSGVSRIHGIQSWVALPVGAEDDAPTFEHVVARDLPRIELDGVAMTLIAGTAYGAESPVAISSPLFYLEATLAPASVLDFGPELGQRGVYVVDGEIEIDGLGYAAGRMLALADRRGCRLQTSRGAKLMLLGGEPLAGEREIWWNFVASDQARINAARARWASGAFPPVPGDSESMAMPG